MGPSAGGGSVGALVAPAKKSQWLQDCAAEELSTGGRLPPEDPLCAGLRSACRDTLLCKVLAGLN